MKKLTEQQKVRRQILFNMPYLLLTFLIKEKVLDSFLDGSSKYAHNNKINLESFYRILRIPDMAIDEKGLQPDYYIDKSIPDYKWIDFVSGILNAK